MNADQGPGGELHAKEASFHDTWAMETPVQQIHVREAFEAITAPENRFILRQMGTLRGKRLLDIGAGLGESSVYFALQGAAVTALDISPGMVERSLDLARYHHVQITGVVSPAEALQVPDSSFDLVFAGNILHHISDKHGFFGEVQRVLVPGGRFFSWDPLAYNPLINVYRRMATQVRTEDETPLTFADVALARQYFRNVHHREFWIASLGLFVKYFLWNHVHPNADRYWKRILKETPRTLWWWLPLNWADVLLTRIPGLRRLAWNMVMWGEKATSPSTSPGSNDLSEADQRTVMDAVRRFR